MKVWVIANKNGKPLHDEWDNMWVFRTRDSAQRVLNGLEFEVLVSIKRMELKAVK